MAKYDGFKFKSCRGTGREYVVHSSAFSPSLNEWEYLVVDDSGGAMYAEFTIDDYIQRGIFTITHSPTMQSLNAAPTPQQTQSSSAARNLKIGDRFEHMNKDQYEVVSHSINTPEFNAREILGLKYGSTITISYQDFDSWVGQGIITNIMSLSPPIPIKTYSAIMATQGLVESGFLTEDQMRELLIGTPKKTNKCTCEIYALMNHGCKCGAIAAERGKR